MQIIHGDDENPYFTTKHLIHSRNNYSFEILWNPEQISGIPNCNGYIVQRVNATSEIQGVRVEETPYFEAWMVSNGKTGNQDYDDIFDCWFVINKGVVTYQTEIYWIDVGDELYTEVAKWVPGKVTMANQLPASYEFPGIENKIPVFGREFEYDNRKDDI